MDRLSRCEGESNFNLITDISRVNLPFKNLDGAID